MNSSTTAGTTLAKSSSVIAFARSSAIFNNVLSASLTGSLGFKILSAFFNASIIWAISSWSVAFSNTSLASSNKALNSSILSSVQFVVSTFSNSSIRWLKAAVSNSILPYTLNSAAATIVLFEPCFQWYVSFALKRTYLASIGVSKTISVTPLPSLTVVPVATCFHSWPSILVSTTYSKILPVQFNFWEASNLGIYCTLFTV